MKLRDIALTVTLGLSTSLPVLSNENPNPELNKMNNAVQFGLDRISKGESGDISLPFSYVNTIKSKDEFCQGYLVSDLELIKSKLDSIITDPIHNKDLERKIQIGKDKCEKSTFENHKAEVLGLLSSNYGPVRIISGGTLIGKDEIQSKRDMLRKRLNSVYSNLDSVQSYSGLNSILIEASQANQELKTFNQENPIKLIWNRN